MQEAAKALAYEGPSRSKNSDEYERIRERSNAIIRELVIEHRRIDVLAEMVLGFKPEPFHVEMLRWQDATQEGLLLAWRGAAKTTFCTITRCLFEMILDPNVRILLAADAVDQAKVILRAIKSHLTDNKRFREVFGDWVTGAKTWSESEITINRRTSHAGESTITCAGIGTALPTRHFDVIIADDLVTKDNSQTEGQRKKVFDYFYETLYPTLESPRGRLWVVGTRWDDEDLYGWLQKEDYRDATFVLGVLDEETDRSRWEAKYPTARLHRIRKANLGAFELQYMLRSKSGGGGIFSTEHFLYYEELPPDCFFWQSVDLAAGQKAHNDFFVHVTLAIHKPTKNPYLVDYRKLHIPFPQQVKLLYDMWRAYPDTIRVVVESNAYQVSLRQQMRDSYPEVPVIGRHTSTDKVARAQQLAMLFTDHQLRVKRTHHEAVRLLCGFPKLKGSKDFFDAVEIGVGQGLRGARKRREDEPGLI